MILFLDFDDVLHPEPCYNHEKLFCYLPKLEKVLIDFPQVRIVLSSIWLETRTFDTLRDFFALKYAIEPSGLRQVGVITLN